MKIKKMTSYGIRVVARLYLEKGKVITSTELAEKEKISMGALMKVLARLRTVGIIKSYQGRGQISGGFSLNKEFIDLDLREVMEALEEEFELYPVCEKAQYEGDYKNIYDFLKEMNEKYKEMLSECKLKDML